MSKKVNPTVIGGFVLGALGLSLAAVLLFGGGQLFAQKARFVLFVEGSAAGLSVGSPVAVRGVKVGSVTEILARVDPAGGSMQIPVFIEIEPRRLSRQEGAHPMEVQVQRWIEKGLRARLEVQSLVTGQLMVSLDFYPDRPVQLAGLDMGVPEIPTIPTPFEEFARTFKQLPLEEIVQRTASSIEGIDRFLHSTRLQESLTVTEQTLSEVRAAARDLRRQIEPTLRNVNATLRSAQVLAEGLDTRSEALATGAQSTLEKADLLLGGVDRRVETLSEKANQALETADVLLRRADGWLGPLAENADETLRHAQILVRRADQRLESLAGQAEETLREGQALVRRVDAHVDPLASGVEETLGEAGNLLRRADPVLTNLLAAAEQASEAVRRVEENVGPLATGLQQAALAATAAFDQARSTLAALDGGREAESPFGYELAAAVRELGTAARALRVLSESLEQRPDALLRGKTGGR
jgi:paraquat-inducible protein B